MGWLDFFKKHSDALLKGAGQGLQASQNNDGIGANIGNALGQMATNKIVGHFNQGEKEDTPVTTTGGQIDTNISYRPTEPLPPKPASDWQSVLSGMNGQQEQTQPVTWQTYLSQQAGAQPEANTMFANVGDPLKKNIALSPYDQARTNVMEVANRPIENKDKGFKGWLKEFASNIGTGMQNAQKNNPNGGFLENLGASLGTGLTGGTVNRTLNEENQKNIDLQKAMQNYGIQNQITDDQLGQEFKRTQTRNIEDDNALNQYRANTSRMSAENRAKSAESRAAIAQYKNLPELDLDTPEGQAFAKEFETATGLPALPKNAKTNSKYYFSEDGKVYLTQSDSQGNTSFAQVLNDDGTPQTFETRGMRTSQDKELDRKFKGEEGKQNRAASITRAQIMANASILNTNTREVGANQRNTQDNEYKVKVAAMKQQYDKPTFIQKGVTSFVNSWQKANNGQPPTDAQIQKVKEQLGFEYDN